MGEPTVVINKLTKKYGDVIAVDGLSFEVETGELFGLLGPNGAGKTTTIRTCLGLLSKTSGEITIFGRDSHKDSVGTLIRIRSG